MTSTHHATLIRSNFVSDFKLEDQQLESELNDVYVEKFGIDNARDLVRQAHQRPLEAKEKTILIRTEFITLEAQNALLKLVEETPESTRLIFVLPQDFILLPTLNSRFSFEQNAVGLEVITNEIFAEFLAAGYKDRISAIDAAIKQKNLNWQRSIKQGLLTLLEKRNNKVLPSTELEYVSRTLMTRGASNKMLLEHIALILPPR